jgi:hypothetical protein
MSSSRRTSGEIHILAMLDGKTTGALSRRFLKLPAAFWYGAAGITICLLLAALAWLARAPATRDHNGGPDTALTQTTRPAPTPISAATLDKPSDTPIGPAAETMPDDVRGAAIRDLATEAPASASASASVSASAPAPAAPDQPALAPTRPEQAASSHTSVPTTPESALAAAKTMPGTASADRATLAAAAAATPSPTRSQATASLHPAPHPSAPKTAPTHAPAAHHAAPAKTPSAARADTSTSRAKRHASASKNVPKPVTPATLDTDVALISAIIEHTNNHPAPAASAAPAVCNGRSCKTRMPNRQ